MRGTSRTRGTACNEGTTDDWKVPVPRQREPSPHQCRLGLDQKPSLSELTVEAVEKDRFPLCLRDSFHSEHKKQSKLQRSFLADPITITN